MNNTKTAYIIFKADIEINPTQILINTLTECINNKNISEICIGMFSDGGKINFGMMLYNFLKSIRKKITIYNIGYINSIANIVFLGVKERYACKNSIFVFHNITYKFPSPSNMETIQSVLESLKKDNERVINTIAENTKIPIPEIEKLHVGDSKILELTYAKKVGIIKDISDFTIKPDGIIYTIS